MLCRRQKASELSTRLMLEGFSHQQSICATLTYADEHLPPLGSVSKRHIDLFFKRLRFKLCRKYGSDFRLSFHCQAEYSPERKRPHYHIAIFGYWPHDAKAWAKSGAGNPEFISDELTALWGMGNVTFQEWSPGAASYIAGHQAHKLTGRLGEAARRRYSPDGLYLGTCEPEFAKSSRRPALGARFLEQHAEQMLRLGFTVPCPGRQVPLPRYFLRRTKSLATPTALEIFTRARAQDVFKGRLTPQAARTSVDEFIAARVAEAPLLSDLKARRALEGRLHAHDSTRARLATRESLAIADVARLKREGVK